MKTTRVFLIALFAAVLLAAGPASAAVNAFLKIDGIPGESMDAQHQGWIELSDFSFGVENPTTIGSATGAARARNSTAPFKILKISDVASPALALALAPGKRIPGIVIEGTKPGGQVYLKIKLENVMVSSFQMGGSAKGGSGLPTDSITLIYQKIEIEYLDATPTPSIHVVKPAVAIAPKK